MDRGPVYFRAADLRRNSQQLLQKEMSKSLAETCKLNFTFYYIPVQFNFPAYVVFL